MTVLKKSLAVALAGSMLLGVGINVYANNKDYYKIQKPYVFQQ